MRKRLTRVQEGFDTTSKAPYGGATSFPGYRKTSYQGATDFPETLKASFEGAGRFLGNLF